MRQIDVAIVGGGLAGSVAVAMLGRAGVSCALIDPHTVYPPDFRVEKFDNSQVQLLRKTGLAPAVAARATVNDSVWIARFGHLIEKRRDEQYDFFYNDMVNTIRAEIPDTVLRICGKATAFATGNERQTVSLSTGEELSARLIVLCNGLNVGLRHTAGITREVLSRCHSISVGFNMKPAGRANFDFRALTYYPEHVSERIAYVSMFPLETITRVNFFTYRELDDPWLRQFKEFPGPTLHAALPGLRALTGEFEVVSSIKVRPIDLYVSGNVRQAGIVLAGDAFATSCPAAGNGGNKVLNDIERLCNVHIPRWLKSEGMGAEKIAEYYDDPIKQACDEESLAKAYYLRSLSTEDSLAWWARRRARFVGQVGLGALRHARNRWSHRPLAVAAGSEV